MLQRRKPTEVLEKESSGNVEIEYENLEPGEHEGRLVFVADLGLQRSEQKGVHKGNFQQLALGIEIVGKTFKKDGEEYPVMIWAKPFFTYGILTERGNELPLALAFNSKAVEGVEFDWDAELGKPVTAVIINKTVKGKDGAPDHVYDNIARLVAIPEKYQAGVAEASIAPASGNGKDVTDHFRGLVKFVWDKQVYEQEAVADAKTDNQFTRGRVPQQTLDDNFDDDIPF